MKRTDSLKIATIAISMFTKFQQKNSAMKQDEKCMDPGCLNCNFDAKHFWVDMDEGGRRPTTLLASLIHDEVLEFMQFLEDKEANEKENPVISVLKILHDQSKENDKDKEQAQAQDITPVGDGVH